MSHFFIMRGTPKFYVYLFGLLIFLAIFTINCGNSTDDTTDNGTETTATPVVTSSAVTSVLVGSSYSYDVNASDADSHTLTYSLTTSPSGMTINSSSGLISWTAPSETGTHDVVVKVTNSVGAYITQSFIITVESNIIVITSTPDTETYMAQLWSYDVNAADSAGKTLTYSLTTSPSGMTINSSSGLVEWTPSDTGEYNVTVKVTDSSGNYVTQVVMVVVVVQETKTVQFISITGATFTMGDDHNAGGSNEKPLHSVTLSAYEISKYEITNAQYAAFLNAYGQDTVKSGTYSGQKMILASGGSYDWGLHKSGSSWSAVSGKENNPVIYVTWYGATEYAAYYSYRLPTEAEWEYAAKGTDGREYPWGDTTPDNTYANYDNNEHQTTALGSYEKGKSWCGAYDMAGNVWEWCSDWYSSSYYSSSPTTNPTGPASGSYRVTRGGSWNLHANGIYCAYRGHQSPSLYAYSIGFRVAR